MARKITKLEPTETEIFTARRNWLDTLPGNQGDDPSSAGYFEQNWRNIEDCKRFVRAEIKRREAK